MSLRERRRLRLPLCVLSALMIAAGSALPALGDMPEDAPRATLRYRGERIQRAELAAWCWPGDDGGMGCSDMRPLPWPKVDVVDSGYRVRLRIHWPKKPGRAHVDSYRSVNDNGVPDGRGSDLAYRIRRVTRGDRTIAWDIRFRVRSERHHYVKTIVEFPRRGSLVWNVHVRTERI